MSPHQCMASRVVPSSEALQALRALVHPYHHGPALGSSLLPSQRGLAYTFKAKRYTTKRKVQSFGLNRREALSSRQVGQSRHFLIAAKTKEAQDDEDTSNVTGWEEPLPKKQRNPSRKGQRRQRQNAATTPEPVAGPESDIVRTLTTTDNETPLVPEFRLSLMYIDGNRASNLLYKIKHLKDRYGSAVGADALILELNKLANSRQTNDWQVAERLFANCTGVFSPVEIKAVRNSIVRQQLEREPPYLEAVSLMTGRGRAAWQIGRQFIVAYMIDFCARNSDLTMQRDEVWKVASGVYRLHGSLDAGFLGIHLSQLIQQGKLLQARATIDQFQTDFPNQRFPMSCYEIIIRGYAGERQWAEIDNLFYNFHERGYLRQQPSKLSPLFHLTWRLYMAHQNDAETSYDLLVHHMTNSGVVPDTRLSLEVVCLLTTMGHTRLAIQHVKDRAKRFPFLPSLTYCSELAYETFYSLYRLLKEPSCEELLRLCKVLCLGAVRLEFDPEFKILALDKIKRGVLNQALAFHSVMFEPLRPLGAIPTTYSDMVKDHEAAINYASWLLDYYDSIYSQESQPGLKTTFLKKELSTTLKTVQELVMMLEDYKAYCHRHGPPDPDDFAGKESGEVVWNRYLEQMDPKLQAYSHKSILTQLNKFVEHSLRHSRGKIDEQKMRDQLIFAWLGPLLNAQRVCDVHDILFHFYNSSLRDAIFDMQVLEFWLYANMVIVDTDAIAFVMWAIIDRSQLDPNPISLRLLALARRCQFRALVAADRFARRKLEVEQRDEMLYLLYRLYRIYWVQIGRPRSINMAESPVKAWRSKVERSQTSTQESHDATDNSLSPSNTWPDFDGPAAVQDSQHHELRHSNIGDGKAKHHTRSDRKHPLDIHPAAFNDPKSFPASITSILELRSKRREPGNWA